MEQKKNKKQRVIKSNNSQNDKPKAKPDKNSGTSSSESSDAEDEEISDNENANNSDLQPTSNNNTAIDMSAADIKKSKYQAKTTKYRSMFNVNIKSKILLYVRNELFKKIKILGNEHLQQDGAIMQEVLRRVQFNPQTDNIHAYMQECKKLLKQTMCSRRGYVKKKIGKSLRGMSIIFLSK